MTIERTVRFQKRQRTRENSASGGSRVPRVSKLMALAIRLDQLIRDGLVTDQAELARLGHVTRARLTQIMNLLCLAPDIQEEILYLPSIQRCRNPLTERQLRPIASTLDWRLQRRMWAHLSNRRVGEPSSGFAATCPKYYRLGTKVESTTERSREAGS
jgi:hypothetical protein